MNSMMDYKPNSHRSKEEQKSPSEERKKVEKVVNGKVKAKKKSSFADVFVSEDAANVKDYIWMDVIVPLVKKTICDIFADIPNMIFYGKPGGGRRSTNSSYVSYRDYSRRDDRPVGESRTRTGYSHDDIILETRGEAEEVLDRMNELIDTYGIVSDADMYDLVGISCNYTDNKYGWTNIRNAEPIRVRDGYMLKLPKAIPIN